MREPRFNFLAELDGVCLRQHRAVRAARHDRVAAIERLQRTHGIERSPCEAEPVLRLGQAALGGMVEAHAKGGLTREKLPDAVLRRALQDEPESLAQSMALAMQARAHRCGEVLLEIIEALR